MTGGLTFDLALTSLLFGGSAARVGIVLNIPTMSQVTLALGLIFSPVAYLAESSVHKGLAEIIENIHANADYLRTVERSILVRTVFHDAAS